MIYLLDRHSVSRDKAQTSTVCSGIPKVTIAAREVAGRNVSVAKVIPPTSRWMGWPGSGRQQAGRVEAARIWPPYAASKPPEWGRHGSGHCAPPASHQRGGNLDPAIVSGRRGRRRARERERDVWWHWLGGRHGQP